ncbi:MAG: transcriptional repressor [Clostridiales bacterium]|nr:transcriptional repressor [Clostridiales bacterium]
MKQQRNTKQRQLILETVLERGDHPSADEIYLEVRKKDDKISRGTVYRNLNLLAQNRQIRQVRTPGTDRFDWRMEQHYHMLCSICGEIVDAPIEYMTKLNEELSEKTGRKIKGHLLIFEGNCPKCSKAVMEEQERT